MGQRTGWRIQVTAQARRPAVTASCQPNSTPTSCSPATAQGPRRGKWGLLSVRPTNQRQERFPEEERHCPLPPALQTHGQSCSCVTSGGLPDLSGPRDP